MKRILSFGIALVAVALGTNALAANFTAGNLVIYRVGPEGTGNNGLTNKGNSVYLDEYSTNGVLQQSIPIRTNYFGANSPLIASGSATAEGQITRSGDSRFIVLTGYGALLGQMTNYSLPGSYVFGDRVTRVVGLVDAYLHVDTTTVQTNSSQEDSTGIRTAVSTDGTNVWFGSDVTGIKYATRASNTATRLDMGTTTGRNVRHLEITNNVLYYSTGATSFHGIYYCTNGLPTVTNDLVYAILTNTANASSSPYGFTFANLGGTDPDTLYIADDGNNLAGQGAVYKWSLVSGIWTSNGFTTANYARSVVANVISSNQVELYISCGGSLTSGTLKHFQDTTGFNADPDPGNAGASTIASAAVGQNFRGIAWTPAQVGQEPALTAQISVGPIFAYTPRGVTGGPFSPASTTYSVANPGGAGSVDWAATVDQTWLTLTPTNGTLGAGVSANVVVSLVSSVATNLDGGSNYTAVITFTNTTSHVGDTTRPAILTVSALVVSPTTNFTASGPVGGPFSPSSMLYTITNTSTVATDWSVDKTATWLDLSATNGTALASHTSTNITASINASANSLVRSPYTDTITFNDDTRSTVVTTRSVLLSVDLGFYDDFSTYSDGGLVGQNRWQEGMGGVGTPGSSTAPIQISGGTVRIPGPMPPTQDDQDAYKTAGYVNLTTNFFGILVTVTNAGPSNINPSYMLAMNNTAGDDTGGASGSGNYRNYRVSARLTGAAGSSTFVFAGTPVGFSVWAFGATTYTTGTTHKVIVMTDPGGSNEVMYVDPSSGVLADQSVYLTATGGNGSATNQGAVVFSQYNSASASQAGAIISRLSVSTNFTTVYNELTPATAPTANFTPATLTAGYAAPLNVTFTDTSTGTAPITRYWDLGDGTKVTNTTGTGDSFGHNYAAGVYTVTLTASNVAPPTSTLTRSGLVWAQTALESWQMHYFNSTNSATAGGSVDYDGDGVNNTSEYLSGFSPTSAVAYARIISIVKTSSDIRVIFLGANGDSTWSPGIPARTNILEFTTGDAKGNYSNNFTTVSNNVLSGGTGVGIVITNTDTGGAIGTNRYYRIRVVAP